MESILCLTDYKANRDQTFRFALYLASRLSAKLFFVHIFEAPGQAVEERKEKPTAPPAETGKESQAFELQRLKAFAKEHGGDYLTEIDIRYLVAGGSRRERILELFQQYDLDLIVMGMRNRTGIADRLFGDLARKMIDKAPCPLLLIPPEASFREIRHIVYATDFGYHNLNAIESLRRWSEGLDAHLHLVHVSEDPEDNQWAETQMEKIKRTFEDENEENRMHFTVLEGEVQEGIENFIETAQSDVIALTTHTRGYWEKMMASSLAKDLAEEVEIPLLVFRE